MAFLTRSYRLIDQDGKEYEPPQIYDVYTDTIRLVTQADVEELLAVRKAYGELTATLRKQQEYMRAEFENAAAKPPSRIPVTVVSDVNEQLWRGEATVVDQYTQATRAVRGK